MGRWEDFKRKYKEGVRRRSPWLAALLNFLAWGLGYLYAGRRRLLGLSLFFFVFTAFAAGGILADPDRFGFKTYESLYLAVGMVLAAWFVVSAALARDAYLEAKTRAKEETRGEKGD